jgi:hypothetical protein
LSGFRVERPKADFRDSWRTKNRLFPWQDDWLKEIEGSRHLAHSTTTLGLDEQVWSWAILSFIVFIFFIKEIFFIPVLARGFAYNQSLLQFQTSIVPIELRKRNQTRKHLFIIHINIYGTAYLMHRLTVG